MTKIIEMLITEEVIEIAKRLLGKGISLEDIADTTQLDIETLKSLQEQEAGGNAE